MADDADDQTHPVINVEEFIGKTVGRRKLRKPASVQKTGRAIYQRSGFRVCDPGIHRFDSFEEADQWMRQMAIKRARQAEKS